VSIDVVRFDSSASAASLSADDMGVSTVLPLEGLTVVVTGEVTGLDRDQANAAVIALGGKPVGSVSGKTGLVVTGVGAGVSKMQKVKQFGTPVLDGDVFAALAADPASWDGQPVGGPIVPEAAAEPVEVYVAPDHQVIQAVIYPQGVRQVRLSCRCGNKWQGAGIHDREKGCPRDPAGYPRASWTPATTVASVTR
jgi:hypothetical protein